MEVKKKAHLQLERNSGLYFAIGMALVLALIYAALEWKTYDAENETLLGQLNTIEEIEEEKPPVVHLTPPPPPPKIQIPVILDIVDDEEDIIEAIIDSNEADHETEVVEPTDFVIEEVEEDVTVIIDLIDEVPVFPGCENAEDKRACFEKMMRKHVEKHIRYPDLAMEMNIQGRVATQFVIDKDGSIADVKMRGPHQILEKEATRILSKLPKMQAGKHKGKDAKVVFSLPITFKMQ